MGDKATRQCWECLRRQVACDGAESVCGNCISTGLVCPGYRNERQIRWFPVGQVSRVRRSKNNKTLTWRVSPNTGTEKTSLTKSNRAGKRETQDDTKSNRNDGQATGEYGDGIDKESSRAPGDTSEGSELMLARQYVRQAILQQQTLVPNYDLTSKEFHLAEAIGFWNQAVIPYAAARRVGMEPFLRPIEAAYVQSKANCWRYLLISLATSHKLSMISQINGLGLDYRSSSLITATWSRFYHYFGLTINALNEEIGWGRSGDLESILQTISVVGSVEVFVSPDPQWRAHAKGFLSVIQHCGGLGKILEGPKRLRKVIGSFIISTTILNTTSPSHEQISEVSNFDFINLQTFLDMETFPIFLSPPYLLLDIVRINRHRAELAAVPEPESGQPSHCKTCEIVRHIDAFVPEDWVESHGLPLGGEFVLLANLFQCAAAVFATLSTPCAYGASGPNSACRALMLSYRNRLFRLVEESLEVGLWIYDIFWPVLVAGVAAAGDDSTTARQVVERILLTAMRDPFTGVIPKVAYRQLQKFWESGKIGWDDCFDKPYYLIL